jgi:dihydrofolate reductase
MRRLVVLSFISLDGVMQAPGGPEEDTSGGFRLGGWTVPYFDDFLGKVMGAQMSEPFDLLLGRETYQLFASYWPTPERHCGCRNQQRKKVRGLKKATRVRLG